VKLRLDRAAAKRRGATRQRDEPDAPALLPENLLPWAIFRACLSQLVIGPAGGVIGICHASLDFKFRVFGVARERESEVFEKFEFLESIYVEEMNAGLANRSAPARETPKARVRPRRSGNKAKGGRESE
jgi:hypothetical protein